MHLSLKKITAMGTVELMVAKEAEDDIIIDVVVA